MLGRRRRHDFVVREQPQLVLIEYLANDYVDAEPAGGVTQYRDDMQRLFDLLLRWGQAGNTHVDDGYVAQRAAAATSRNLFLIDVYAAFLALPEATLLSYYLDPSMDHAHLNETGHAAWAQVASDAIVAKLAASPAPAPPPTASPTKGGGGGGGCGATGAEVLLALAAILRRRRSS